MQCPSAKSAAHRFKSVPMPLLPVQVPRVESKNIKAISVEIQSIFMGFLWSSCCRREFTGRFPMEVTHVSHAFAVASTCSNFCLCLVNLVAWCHHGETLSMAMSQHLRFHVPFILPFIPFEGGRLVSHFLFWAGQRTCHADLGLQS